MKRFLWVAPILFVAAMSVGASADTVQIFLFPNDGSGDNFGFQQQGKGGSIILGGGTPFAYFNAIQGYAAGSPFGGSTPVFIDSVELNGTIVDTIANSSCTLFIPSFTFPTDGTGVGMQVTATFSGTLVVYDANNHLQQININDHAEGFLSFYYDSTTGLYYPSSPVIFTGTTPEPGTLGLMTTGILGMLGIARRKFTGRFPTSSVL